MGSRKSVRGPTLVDVRILRVLIPAAAERDSNDSYFLRFNLKFWPVGFHFLHIWRDFTKAGIQAKPFFNYISSILMGILLRMGKKFKLIPFYPRAMEVGGCWAALSNFQVFKNRDDFSFRIQDRCITPFSLLMGISHNWQVYKLIP